MSRRATGMIALTAALVLVFTAAACKKANEDFSDIRTKIYSEAILIDEIVCVSENYQSCKAGEEYDDGLIAEGFDGYIHESYTEGLSVQIKCEFLPRNANAFKEGKPFDFIFERNDDKYTVELPGDGTCIIRFAKSATCDVTVKSQDGSNKSLKIRIEALGSWGEYF